MKDSKPSSPGTLSPQSPQSPQRRRSLLRLRRLLHAMEHNEAPSDASWRSLSQRAQLAQDLWRQVQDEMEAEEDDLHWLQNQVDEACLKAHQFARQRFQQESSSPDLIQTAFFAAPIVDEPAARSRAESRDSSVHDLDPELGMQDDEIPTDYLAHPLTSELSKPTMEELQKAHREQIEEAISQMASQMKEETKRIHSTLRGQTQELDTMEDLATQNVQKVGKVADNVKTHVATSWRRTFATWTLLLTIFGTFAFCIMTIQIVPKRNNACLWMGCESPLVPKLVTGAHNLATNAYHLAYGLVQKSQAAPAAVLEHGIHNSEKPESVPTLGEPGSDKPQQLHRKQEDSDDRKTCELTVDGECRPVIHHKKTGEGILHHELFSGHDSENHKDSHEDPHSENEGEDCTHQSILVSAQMGQLAELRRCLSLHPEWLNQMDENHWTAIHEAAHAGWLEVVEYLVNAGASLNAMTNSGQTALEVAMHEHGENHELTKFLREHHVAQTEAASPEHVVEGDHHHDHNSNIHDAHQGHDEIHEEDSNRLTGENANQSENEEHHVHFQQEHDVHSHDSQAPPSEVHEVQASHATESAQSDNCVVSEFQLLAHSGNLEELQRCLSRHPDWVNHVYDQGWTALHEAGSAGHVHVVEYLLRSGANADARTIHDHTALDLARQHFGEEHAATQVLMQHSRQHHAVSDGEVNAHHHEAQQHADIATSNSYDEKPVAPASFDQNPGHGDEHSKPLDDCQPDQIQWLAHLGNFEDLQRCLPRHLDYLNRADGQGWTPLHEASRAGHTQIVEYLLKLGANTELRTNLGQSALDLANQHLDHHHTATQLLLQYAPQHHSTVSEAHGNHESHSNHAHDNQVHHSSSTVQHSQSTENVPNPAESNIPVQGDCTINDFLWYASIGQFNDVKHCVSLHSTLLNQADDNGWTATHEAARGGHVQTLEFLLQSGANANVLTNLGRSPLDLAVQAHGDGHVVTQMLHAALSRQ